MKRLLSVLKPVCLRCVTRPTLGLTRLKKQWETVAYIDRDEAWAMYEPQVRQRADAFTKLFNAAEAETELFRKFFQYQRAALRSGDPIQVAATSVTPADIDWISALGTAANVIF
jgi:hypothetical protein